MLIVRNLEHGKIGRKITGRQFKTLITLDVKRDNIPFLPFSNSNIPFSASNVQNKANWVKWQTLTLRTFSFLSTYVDGSAHVFAASNLYV
jgi:hypothetical protein